MSRAKRLVRSLFVEESSSSGVKSIDSVIEFLFEFVRVSDELLDGVLLLLDALSLALDLCNLDFGLELGFLLDERKLEEGLESCFGDSLGRGLRQSQVIVDDGRIV